MLKEAQTKMGRIFFGVLCDGMGGLSNGELASATVIRAMEQWFETDFPQLLVHTTDAEEVLEKVKNDWHVIANELKCSWPGMLKEPETGWEQRLLHCF